MFFLKAEEIGIREFNREDISNKVKWINDPKNNAYLHYDLPLSEEKTLVWFENRAKNRLDCVIEYAGIPVGLVGLIGIDEVNRKAEFYISMGRDDFKGKGIATKAVRLILKYAFSELKLNKVYLNVDEENLVARNLYEKAGFAKEGLFIEDIWHNGRMINRVRYAVLAKAFMLAEKTDN